MATPVPRVHPLAGSAVTVRIAGSDKVVHTEHPFRNAQGLTIHSQTFAPLPGTTPIAAILVLHGLNTHAGYSFASYDYGFKDSILQKYVDAKIVVHTIDMQGFGKSEGLGGKRGHIANIEHVVTDIVDLCHSLKARMPALPLFLHGQCFGGAMATWVAQIAPPELLRGCVLTVPNIALAEEAMPSALIVSALSCVASVAPALPILSEPEDTDADFQFRFEADPYCYAGPVRASWCNELRLMYAHFERTLGEMRLPFICFQSTRDDFCNPEGSYRLYEQAMSADKTLVEVTNMGHAVITEDGCEDIISRILDWVQPRARAPATDKQFARIANRSQLAVTKAKPLISFSAAAKALRFTAKLSQGKHLDARSARAQTLWLLRG